MLERFLPRTEFSSYDDFKQNYRLNVPEHFNFAYDVMDEWAKEAPDRPALYWTNGKDPDVSLTFADIKRISDKTANALRAIGIGRGDRVLVMLKQRTEVWTTFLALHKLCAVCIPATFQLTKKDIVYRCNSANVKLIVTVDDPGLLANIDEARPDCTTLEKVAVVGSGVDFTCGRYLNMRQLTADAPEAIERVINENSDTMLMYFTSGTTGMPKMILHDYEYPLGHIVTAKYWQQVEEGGRHLTMADSGWAKFAWGKIYGQWICGAEIVAYDNDKFVPEEVMETMQRLKLTTFCAPPTVYRFLIKEDMSRYDFSSIKHCGIAGEPLNPEVYYKLKELAGLEVREGFGQSETSVIIANFPWMEVKPGSTGKPSPLYDLDIVDDDGNSCEDGVVGHIVIKNAKVGKPQGLFVEYCDAPEANAKAFHDNVYDTGDMAWRDGDGYYWFEGRSDDVIKCSGYRIGPFEVESALMTHPSVLECAITAAPDPVRGQVVKATIVLAKGYTPSEALKKELQNHVKHTTAPYKYPRIVEFVEELPKTTSGKIRRAEIRRTSESK